MAKTIWIVNYYTGTPKSVSNPRYIELAKNFMAAGYNVITFNSTMRCETELSEEDKQKMFVERVYDGFKFVHVKSPHFVGNGAKRIFSIFMFAWRLYRNAKKFEKPDIVLHNIHAPFDYPVLWAARKMNAKYIAEAWDLWPEVFSRVGLVRESNPLLKVLHRMEYHLYRKADSIIFTLEGGIDYLRKKGWTLDAGGKLPLTKIHYINNGIDLGDFDENVIKFKREDQDLSQDGIYRIIYMGSIRLVNEVKLLIDAANSLKDNPKYKFLIYGDGTDRDMLEQYVKDNNITNVVFKEKRIPLREVAYVVSQASVNVMNYTKGFGLYGTSSGKMFQYLAAGRPICCNVKLNYSEISREYLGIDKYFDSIDDYAAAIRSLAEQPKEEYDAMCKRVRQCAEKYDYKVLARKELDVIESLI